MIKRAGFISITSTDKGGEEPCVHLRVLDAVSGQAAADTFISMKDLALALTGQARIPCTLSIGERVGLTRETKFEALVFSGKDAPSNDQMEQAIKQYEIDGWQGNRTDAKNHHNWGIHKGNRIVQIIFERHVQIEEQNDGKKNQS